jgi:hypothetical protein
VWPAVRSLNKESLGPRPRAASVRNRLTAVFERKPIRYGCHERGNTRPKMLSCRSVRPWRSNHNICAGDAVLTNTVMYHQGNRRLQDEFDSRRIADWLNEKLTRTLFTSRL